jgi:hypothetical protein
MQETWDKLVKKFERLTDGLGMPIDLEILETVVALNALGINTIMSCGGHIDERGLLLPWVDIASADPALEEIRRAEIELARAAGTLRNEVRHLLDEGADRIQVKAAQERLQDRNRELLTLQLRERAIHKGERDKLLPYLSRFYENRLVPFDRRLILNVRLNSGKSRLENQGAGDFYFFSPPDIQQKKLTEYREEINAFTHFLKTCYFSHQLLTASF